MVGRIHRKPSYGLAELCQRWEVSELDIANFVVAGELTLSVTAAGMRIEEGSIERVDDGDWFRIPERTRYFTGTLDLRSEDAWSIITFGVASVTHFKAAADSYIRVSSRDGEHDYCDLGKERLVVSQAELRRFEAAQQAEIPAGAVAPQPGRRGPAPKYDWDAFWHEIAIRLYKEGLPAQKDDLVEQMLQWFEDHGGAPDASYVRKKIKPFWEQFEAAVRN